MVYNSYKNLISKKNSKKILGNIIWLFLDKFLRMGLGFYVVLKFARYLGPDYYGVFNYSSAIIALFASISSLGLNSVLTRELILLRQEKVKLLGTAFGLRLLSASCAYIVLIIAMLFLKGDDSLVLKITLIMGLALFFGSAEVLKSWFESQTNSKVTVIVQNIAFFISAILKLYLISIEAPVIYFAYVLLIEAFLVFLGLLFAYNRSYRDVTKWRFDYEKSKYLLSESWPLIISSAAWIIYTKSDQIMIGQLLDSTQVGLYSAATKLGDIAIFVPVVIVSSVVPSILKLRKEKQENYHNGFQLLYNLVVSLMLVIAILVTIFSDYIINILFGVDYLKSSTVLSIHFWIVVCSSLAIISGRFLVNEGLQKVTMFRHVFGATLNLPLNYIMIPNFGIEGAAISSLISLFVANYIFDAFDMKTRFVFKQKTIALSHWWIISYLMKKVKCI